MTTIDIKDTAGKVLASHTMPNNVFLLTLAKVMADGTMLAAQVRNPIGGWEVLLMDLVSGVRRRVPVEGNY